MDLIRYCRVSLSLYVMICVCSRLQLAPKRCSHPESYLLLRHRPHITVVTSLITLHFRYLQDSPPSFQERKILFIYCIYSQIDHHHVRQRTPRRSKPSALGTTGRPFFAIAISLVSEAAAPTAVPSSSVCYLRYMKVGPLSMVHHPYLLVNCN